jgi:hypothetical protein
VVLVYRKPIFANLVAEPADFDLLLSPIVVIGAQTLQLTKPEFEFVTVVTLNVIRYRGRGNFIESEAHLAERFDLQLMLTLARPPLSHIPETRFFFHLAALTDRRWGRRVRR